jgi:YVTN family beta-propeller protein
MRELTGGERRNMNVAPSRFRYTGWPETVPLGYGGGIGMRAMATVVRKRMAVIPALAVLAVLGGGAAAGAGPAAAAPVSARAAAGRVVYAYVGHGYYKHGRTFNAVTPVNTATNKRVPGRKIGPGPIAIAPDGTTAYVVNEGTAPQFRGTVTPVNTATNTAGKPIKVGQDPNGIAISPDGKTVYVVNR